MDGFSEFVKTFPFFHQPTDIDPSSVNKYKMLADKYNVNLNERICEFRKTRKKTTIIEVVGNMEDVRKFIIDSGCNNNLDITYTK